MIYAHIFRRDTVNHVVVTHASKVRRNGSYNTACGLVVDDTFQRRMPFSTLGMADEIGCASCTDFMVALLDELEQAN